MNSVHHTYCHFQPIERISTRYAHHACYIAPHRIAFIFQLSLAALHFRSRPIEFNFLQNPSDAVCAEVSSFWTCFLTEEASRAADVGDAGRVGLLRAALPPSSWMRRRSSAAGPALLLRSHPWVRRRLTAAPRHPRSGAPFQHLAKPARRRGLAAAVCGLAHAGQAGNRRWED